MRWKLSLAVLGVMVAVSGSVSWYLVRANSRVIDDLIASVEDMEPAIRSGFDVYLDGNRLVYVKEECGDEDVVARFFLHLYPVDVADLPDRRRRHGFDNLDFDFGMYGFRDTGRCVAVRVLPGYETTGIRTGQFISGKGQEWSGRIGTADRRSD